MSNKVGPLHIAICDDGYRLSTSSGDASYTLNGIQTLKVGIVDNLPDKLTITDRRSLPSALNVSAASALWGANVEWEWPKEADESWHASIRASWVNGEYEAQQGKRVNYPETAYTISGVPAGIDITASITLHNDKGQRSRPAELTTKSSDDAAKILDGMFTINNGQVFIKDAAGITRAKVCKFDQSAHAAPSADKIREIVSRYLTGEATEYEDELVGELKSFIEKESAYTRLATLISEQVRQRIKAESQPGGLLHGR